MIRALQRDAAKRTTRSADSPETPVARARNVAAVIAVVVIGITSMVGILIISRFGEVAAAANTPLDQTSADIVTGFGDAMGLVPIILLVLLASVVISIVQGMRS